MMSNSETTRNYEGGAGAPVPTNRWGGPVVKTLFSLILFVGVGVAPAMTQQPARIPRVGFLNPLDRTAPHFEAFRRGLADLGYVEGRNVVIEPRFAEGQYDRFPALLAELVGLKVDVIAVTGAVTARAASSAIRFACTPTSGSSSTSRASACCCFIAANAPSRSGFGAATLNR